MKTPIVRNILGHVNQFDIELPDGSRAFQSYNSLIAVYKKGVLFVDPDYVFFSRTTAKHFNAWADFFPGALTIATEIKKALDNGWTKQQCLQNGFVFKNLNK